MKSGRERPHRDQAAAEPTLWPRLLRSSTAWRATRGRAAVSHYDHLRVIQPDVINLDDLVRVLANLVHDMTDVSFLDIVSVMTGYPRSS